MQTMKTLGALVLMLLIFTVFSAQTGQAQTQISTPKKRTSLWIDNENGESFCSSRGCLRRTSRQDDMGPFWANRGKKDPSYMQQKLYAEEPHWILVRREDESFDRDYDPFFITRGKKDDDEPYETDDFPKKKLLEDMRSRDRRDYGPAAPSAAFDELSPFFAARGKKADQ